MPSLYPFQQEFLQKAVYLSTLGPLRHLLADDTGTGKTPQAIEVLKSINLTSGYALIVCTVSMLDVWRAEIEKWAGCAAFIIRGTPAKRQEILASVSPKRIYIISYGTLYEDREFFWDNPPEFIVLDEAHKIKNPQTRIAKTILKIDAEHRLPMTATPEDKKPSEIWTVWKYLDVPKLPPYQQFVKSFDGYDYTGPFPKYTGPKNLPALRFLTGPYMTRRMKRDVLQHLPEVTEETISLAFDAKQAKMYDEISWNDVTRRSDGSLLIADNVLARALRLKQICVNPALVGGINVSPKFQFILDAAEAAVRPICVFSQFKTALNLLQPLLEDAGFPTVKITGDDGTRARNQAVEALNSGTARICLLTSAGGEGLTLTGADRMIFLDYAWARTTLYQAKGRVDRNGQKNPVLLTYLTMEGSIDGRVLKMLNQKEGWSEQILLSSVLEDEIKYGRAA